MKKWAVTILGTAMLLGACGGNDTDNKTEDAKTTAADPGLELYQNKSCVGCHGKDLEGASGPNLQKVGSKYSESEILDIIKNGKGTMPKNQAEGDDAKKIAEYLAKQK